MTESQWRPQALLAVAEPERSAFFPPATMQRLSSLCEVTIADPRELRDIDRYASAMREIEVAITSWGFPQLDSERLSRAPRLGLVVHSGSSVRFLVDDAFWAAGIPIVQAGDAMAPAVAELSLAFTLALLRRIPRLDHGLHAGQEWGEVRQAPRGREIGGARVVVVGASRTGRRYVDACLALGADVVVVDPYIPDGDPLRGRVAVLHDALATGDVIAVHAPLTDETRGLIGAKEIALIRDGACFVNTARAAIVDMDALYDNCVSGRIDAAIDVFDLEPLPSDDRWRGLPNVALTPHLGGATHESRARAGRIVAEEIAHFMAGEPLQHLVDRDRWDVIG